MARAAAIGLILAVLVVLAGNAHTLDADGALALQGRAADLQQRWAQMVADGVAFADLAEIESELSSAEKMHALDPELMFWRPDTTTAMDRWEASTEAIWRRSVEIARRQATAMEVRLHAVLRVEPFVLLNQRLQALDAASTPADLMALATDWELQALLVPIDWHVSALVGGLSTLVTQARSLGIATTPAPSTLAGAAAFASLDDTLRLESSQPLAIELAGVAKDLAGRIAAAPAVLQAFSRADSAMAVGSASGVNVSGYRARVEADQRAYATVTTPAQFEAIRKDLDAIVLAVQRDAASVQRPAQRPAPRQVAAAPSQVYIVSGVAIYYQSHALSCEETAMSMALTHQGIYLSQNQILAELGFDRRPQYRDKNGVLHWGDPYVSFVGNVDGIENVTGLQANYTALVRVAQAHGARIIAAGNISAGAIYAALAAGHPVVVYATWDWAWHPRHDYVAFDGRRIPYIAPAASHVYAAVGVRSNAVLVNDPIRGQYWVAKSSFQAAYSDFTEAIVFA